MDKKTITGLLVIGVILFGFTWYNSRQARKFQAEKATADSIALAQERLNAHPATPQEIMPIAGDNTANAVAGEQGQPVSADSLRVMQYGRSLFEAATGEETLHTVENDVMKVTFSNKGGKVTAVELKQYDKFSGGHVGMYEDGSARFDLSFYIMNEMRNVQVNTGEYFFNTEAPAQTILTDGNEHRFTMRLDVDTASYVEYVYTLRKDDYMLDFDINFVNMEHLLSNQSDMEVTWESLAQQNEKGNEQAYNFSTISYKYPGDDDLENLGSSKASKSEDISSSLQWIAFKQRFFSSVFIADNNFANAELKYDTFALTNGEVKHYAASLAVPFNKQTTEYSFKFYYGPNKYSTLKSYDQGMQKLVPLGGWIIGWINRWIVIPVFDFLSKYISSYGLIILLLTIFIKILIFPLTYKSYLSGAKMRLIKPEVEALSAKYPKQEDAMKKQQATMELYKKAGINPMGGCLPLLIQLPILIAMFRFFPGAIELRGESFLWATDLSSYDSIIDLPFTIPFYGDHVSLFTLLMAVGMHISARITSSQQGAASTAPGMGGMKFMTLWLMPIMMMFWFNNYSSGLSYYYFLSTLITIGQTYLVRAFVNDDKLHARMKAAAAKKPKKKSKWQQRYEEAVRAQQQQAKGGKKH